MVLQATCSPTDRAHFLPPVSQHSVTCWYLQQCPQWCLVTVSWGRSTDQTKFGSNITESKQINNTCSLPIRRIFCHCQGQTAKWFFWGEEEQHSGRGSGIPDKKDIAFWLILYGRINNVCFIIACYKTKSINFLAKPPFVHICCWIYRIYMFFSPQVQLQ